ncbi:3-isopropylmalate dehydratase large subunit [Candidimonas nitroreducens]|uniref:3-isopropylmalate dehydratase n=1 Tax=Candidimonas nitroreducens TaxID=683354 RepID=A0A225MFZ0_9BURK|nr:3-isopropylmalate dehydratase large subunit [Candidimonas nitroreducens]OWT60237.1 3-isopropylmalate dehydratase large subunit [Candidimonas nitroreducens]
MDTPRTLFEKIWQSHTIIEEEGGQSLLYVDWLLCSEGSIHAFNILRQEGVGIRRPGQVKGVADHYASTSGPRLQDVMGDDRRNMIRTLERNTGEFGVELFGLEHPARGIQHLVGPEQGMTQPGLIVLCGDSHTSTQSAVGALAFSIGGELAHALATQTVWQRKPRKMRVWVKGTRPRGVSAKDVILAIIAQVGHSGALQHAVEYDGPAIRAMSIEERMTVCNMSVEAGARLGIIGPDEKTYEYLRNRPYGPREGEEMDRATAYWRTLPTDPGALFDKEHVLDAGTLTPMVTWGNTPADAVSIEARVPDPQDESDEQRRNSMERSLQYMGLRPGTRMQDIAVDQVFIGSCTNGRLADLRAAASVIRGRRAVVPALVSPGSQQVKRNAEAEGLDRIFREAGFTWGEASCSMCVGMNGDSVPEGMRCASTSNRNFRGRQGPGSRTHLLGPEMAAAAALAGRLTDVREWLET